MEDGEKQKSKRINFEMIIAVSGVVIAGCALALTVMQSRFERVTVQTSILPILYYDAIISSDGLAMRMRNAGTGSAHIKQFAVTVDGDPVRNWIHMLQVLEIPPPSTIEYSLKKPDHYFPPNSWEDRSSLLLGISADTEQNKDAAAALFQARERVDVHVCFCDLLGRCWSIPDDGLFPHCEATGTYDQAFFEPPRRVVRPPWQATP